MSSDTDLGCIETLMGTMGLKRTYMQALKRCANSRHSEANPTCFTGNMSCKRWIMEWLQRNRDFRVTLVYPSQSQKLATPELK